MNPVTVSFIVLATLFTGIVPALAQVSLPEQREATLAKVERFEILPVGSGDARFEAVENPFYALTQETEDVEAPEVEAEAEAPVEESDRVVLQRLAERVNPTGVMRFGQKILLLFGERRVEVGDSLSIPHDGHDYRVEVIAADAKNLTLRLNNAQISKRIQ